MKISYNWLKQYLICELTLHQLCEILTDIGLEVESCKESKILNPILDHVILGEVRSCAMHPNADHLKLTHVGIRQKEELQIVCGVPNIIAGQKVLVTPFVGAHVLDREGKQIRLKKSKSRGVTSEGMICSDDELTLEGDSKKILLIDSKAPLGAPESELFQTDKDYLIEIGLTPNRSDAMGHWGVARDLYAALKARGHKAELHKPKVEHFKSEENISNFPLYIESPDRCVRYSGCLITDIKIAPSPPWLQKRLQTLGLNPINNVVDVTNFVMHEFGQPLHTFDADCLEGKEIHVKTLSEGQSFRTLDHIKRTLSDEDLMICDAQKPLCMAGILGGLDSGITQKTQNIFLESSCFDPISIRQSAKRHKLSTDASFRFERGVDPEQVVYALKRAALLIKEIAGGKISKPIDLYPNPVKAFQVKLRYEKINRLLGEILPKEKVKKILFLLEIDILSEEDKTLRVSIPPYRIDVVREVDLIEELLRIYGYNLIKTPKNFCFFLNYEKKSKLEELEENTATILNAQGFYELINLSLTHRKYQKFIKDSSDQSIELLNPLSEELAILRQSLLFGLMERISYNISRKNTSLKFFEWGKTYSKKEGKYIENYHLSLIITGKEQKEHWLHSSGLFSFFALKGVVEALLKKNRVQQFTQQLKEDPLLDKSLLLVHRQKPLAHLGRVKKSIVENFDINQEVFYAEICWKSVVNIFQENKIYIQELPKYPRVRRDLAILLDTDITFEKLYESVQETERKLVKSTILFDVYKGGKLPKGKKSYALSFQLEDPQETLTDERIEKVMENIRNKLRKTLGAEFR